VAQVYGQDDPPAGFGMAIATSQIIEQSGAKTTNSHNRKKATEKTVIHPSYISHSYSDYSSTLSSYSTTQHHGNMKQQPTKVLTFFKQF
jgi:hypothetical protein